MAGRVVGSPCLRPLVLASGLTDRVPPRGLRAVFIAVAIPVVAVGAEVEHLPALTADNEP